MIRFSPNFVLLDVSRPEIANLIVAMVQARDATERRSWAHPQEPTGEEWWADVLADPRARKRERRGTPALTAGFVLKDRTLRLGVNSRAKPDGPSSRISVVTGASLKLSTHGGRKRCVGRTR